MRARQRDEVFSSEGWSGPGRRNSKSQISPVRAERREPKEGEIFAFQRRRRALLAAAEPLRAMQIFTRIPGRPSLVVHVDGRGTIGDVKAIILRRGASPWAHEGEMVSPPTSHLPRTCARPPQEPLPEPLAGCPLGLGR